MAEAVRLGIRCREGFVHMNAPTDRIAAIELELQGLELRRQELLLELREIRSREKAPELPLGNAVPRTNDEKIALFFELFAVRRDVYPKLWVNHKKGSKDDFIGFPKRRSPFAFTTMWNPTTRSQRRCIATELLPTARWVTQSRL